MDIKIVHNAGAIADAIARKPEEMLPKVDAALFRGAIELADEIRRQAPKVTSTLTNSTQIKAKPLEYTIVVASRYAAYVHEGTKDGGQPTLAAMLEWIRLKNIKPREPGMTVRSLASLIRRSIAKHGTPANPFATRALEAKAPRLNELVQAAALQALAGGRV